MEAFPGQARVGAKMRARQDALPAAAKATRDAEALVDSYVYELEAYRRTGTHGSALEEKMWGSLIYKRREYFMAHPEAAKGIGINEVNSTREWQAWAHEGLALKPWQRLARAGEGHLIADAQNQR